MQQHSGHRTYAAVLTPAHVFFGLTQQHWCRHSHAAVFMQHHVRSSIFQLQHVRCLSHAASFCRSVYASACEPPHLRWCSAGGQEPLGEHLQTLNTTPAGRRGGRVGGLFFLEGRCLKRGVLGWWGKKGEGRGGGACYVLTYPPKGCVTVEYRTRFGVGCYVLTYPPKGCVTVEYRTRVGVGFWAKRESSWAKRDPIWENSMKSGQKCSKIGSGESNHSFALLVLWLPLFAALPHSFVFLAHSLSCSLAAFLLTAETSNLVHDIKEDFSKKIIKLVKE